MRLSLLTDYALRTLIYLAGRSARANVHEVADFYRISPHHVAKVVHRLARLGYIRSIRGVGGGIEMVRPAEEILIGEVILACEGNLHLLECVATPNVCVIQPSCRLKRVLAEAERLQTEYLNGVRLSDIVTPGGQLLDNLPVYAVPLYGCHCIRCPRTACLRLSYRASVVRTVPRRTPIRGSRPTRSSLPCQAPPCPALRPVSVCSCTPYACTC